MDSEDKLEWLLLHSAILLGGSTRAVVMRNSADSDMTIVLLVRDQQPGLLLLYKFCFNEVEGSGHTGEDTRRSNR